MNVEQKRKILIRIQEVDKELSDLKAVRAQLLSNPYQSATISSGGGSRSYTVADSSRLSEAISELTEVARCTQCIVEGAEDDIRQIVQGQQEECSIVERPERRAEASGDIEVDEEGVRTRRGAVSHSQWL